MITQLTDDILGKYSDDEIAAYIREEHFRDRSIPSDAIAHYIAAVRMEPTLRAAVFRLFYSAPLVCKECGAPSCIHGYSDD